MSKTTQQNPAVEKPATETVSKPSTRAKRSTKNTDTVNTAEKVRLKPRVHAIRLHVPKTTSSQQDSKSITQTSVQQVPNMSQNTVRRVAIIGGNRIPFARSNGAYFTASNTDMFTAALNGLVERFNLQGQRLGKLLPVQS